MLETKPRCNLCMAVGRYLYVNGRGGRSRRLALRMILMKVGGVSRMTISLDKYTTRAH